jgi:hypothetical protein
MLSFLAAQAADLAVGVPAFHHVAVDFAAVLLARFTVSPLPHVST